MIDMPLTETQVLRPSREVEMSWNYRVMSKDGQLAIYEVFYYPDGTVQGYSDSPVFPRAESLSDLKEEVERYATALQREVLLHK